MQAPAALAAVPFLFGAAAGMLLADHPDGWLPLCAASAAVLSLLAALGLFVDDDPAGVAAAVAIGCALAGVSLGAAGARAAYRPGLLAWFDARAPEDREDPTLLEGVLREDASPAPFGASITLDVTCVVTPSPDAGVKAGATCGAGLQASRSAVGVQASGPVVPIRGGVRLSIGGTASASRIGDWRAGRTVRLPALLRRPAPFGNPGGQDEPGALARRGIVLIGSVKSAALVDVTARGGRVQEAAAAARAWARRQLARHVGGLHPQSGAIATAILIGDRSGLSEEDERRLQEAGTYHVIAISGGNIAIITAMLLFAMRAARWPSNLSAAAAIAILLFYGQITGGGASVSRAVAAACVYLAGRVLDHRGPAMNALAVAAVFAVATSPLAPFDPGFILSFGATLGILLGTPRLLRAVLPADQPKAEASRAKAERRGASGVRRIGHRIASAGAALVAGTACAELALAPVSATLFSRITIAGLVLNFVAIPLMTVVQTASIATLAAAAFPERVAPIFGRVVHAAATGLVQSARLVDIAPWLSRDVAPPAWWLVAAYYLSCAALLVSRRHARLTFTGIAVSVTLMLAGRPPATRGVPAPAFGTLRVAFLDVGQGDATLAILPDGRSMLVDAGGLAGSTFDIGERVLAPSLRAFGVRRLETLVVTHGDPDHIGGGPAAMRRFAPRTVWEGVPVPPHAGLQALAAAAGRSSASWRTVQAGDREITSGVEIHVLHPPPPDWERQRVRNDDSVVLELRLGGVSIVLPGDIGTEGEQLVAARLAPRPITILKAPHHGSATSSTPPFIAAANPAAVIFSAGRGNRFGHPSPVVAARYREAGASIFRTDEDGAVVVDTDGKRVEVRTWSGRRLTLPR
jgi:competence protein ComEC